MGRVPAAFDFRGDSDVLLACYDKAILRVTRVSSARPMIHPAVPRDYGLVVCDVGETDEAPRSLEQNPQFRTAVAERGLSEPTQRVFDIHSLGWPVSALPMYR